MSNKGLTFLIIFLLLLCGATFGAFYLKTHPEMALSQKIFGAKVASVNDENVAVNNVPVDNTNQYNNTNVVENTVPLVGTNPTDTTNPSDVKVTPQGKPDDTVIAYTPPPVETTPVKNPVVTTPPVTPPPTTTSSKITLTLKKGSKGTEVKILQQFLIDNSYLTGKADGAFGAMTEAAVKKFQTEYKLTVDGIVSGKTTTTINELLASN